MGTLKDALKKWFYTNNSSAASFDARVALMDSSGNPKGSDTMANIASVLGTPDIINDSTVSINDSRFRQTGRWYLTSSVQDRPGLASIGGILETIRYNDSRIMQRYTSLTAQSTQYPDAIPAVYVRTVGSSSEVFTKWAVLTGTIVT